MSEPARCSNCETPLVGRYCGTCGQDSVDPPTDALGLLGLLASSLSGFESKALRSFRTLLFSPGRLTRTYIDGQRIRYSGPGQIYAWCTTAFFLTQAVFPVVRLNTETGVVVSSLSAITVGVGLSPETLARLADQGTSLPVFAERFDAAVTAYFPVLLIGLVLGSVLLLALQFWREPALKHVVFALHWAAFYFTLEMLRQLLPRTGSMSVPASALMTVLTLVYLYRAMRVVYARGRIGTALRAFFSVVAFASLLGVWLWSTTALAQAWA